jgi:hypothetical protein
MLCWLLSLGAVYLLWRRGLPLSVKFGLTAVLAVVFSPHLYMHDASLLLVAVVCALLAAPSDEVATHRLNRFLLPCALLTISMCLLVLQVTDTSAFGTLSVLLLGGVLSYAFLRRQAVGSAASNISQ